MAKKEKQTYLQNTLLSTENNKTCPIMLEDTNKYYTQSTEFWQILVMLAYKVSMGTAEY